MIKVGAERDYDLEIRPAMKRDGELGVFLRFQRGGEKLLIFLGREEAHAVSEALVRAYGLLVLS